MTQTIARIKQKGELFEIVVELEEALKFKKGETNFLEIAGDKIFRNSKRGDVASNSDLQKCFDTTDVMEIAKRIVKNGEILLTQEFRDEERENKIKQVIDFLSRNTINPQNNKPHTPERIKSALEEAHVNIKNVPIENQIQEIIEHISRILPIKIETKRFKIVIPSIYTGKIYNLIVQYKEEENWMNDGSLEAIVKIPAGMTMDFFDKLNSITHGAAVTEEIKE